MLFGILLGVVTTITSFFSGVYSPVLRDPHRDPLHESLSGVYGKSQDIPYFHPGVFHGAYVASGPLHGKAYQSGASPWNFRAGA